MNMRLTKKAAALLVAATMIASVGVTPVFAVDANKNSDANIQNDTGANVTAYTTAQSGYTKLTYEVTSGYTWSIPADITFTKDSGVNKDVDVTATTDQKTSVVVKDCKLPKDYTLKVTVKGDGTTKSDGTSTSDAFSIKSDEGQVLDYKITKGSETSALLVNGEVLSVPAGTATETATLKFTLSTAKTTAEVAGTYTGYAIFTAQATNGGAGN